MEHLTWLTIVAGTLAATSTLLALRAAHRLKRAAGQPSLVLNWYWGTVSAYMISFTLLRLAYTFGASEPALVGLFYVQTLTGASTVVSLASIMFGVVLPTPQGRQVATGTFLALAVMTVTLIFSLGVTKTVDDAWGIEFLPNSVVARSLVAIVYMLMPIAMAVMVTRAGRHMPPDINRRFLLFSASVVLMYIPNAVKYVVTFEGATNAILAAIMMVGAVVGWQAYSTTESPDSAGNG